MEKHKYEYEIDPRSDSAGARVLALTPRAGRVLELGAGPGSMTRHLTGLLGCSVVALEYDQSAIERLRCFTPSVHAVDLNGDDWDAAIRAREGTFDAAIAADVLEHLYDPWAVLGRMKRMLSDKGSIILSLPHAGHCTIAACLLDEDFEYREWGLLDRTHIRFFGLKNIQSLHQSQGLAIEDAYFVVRTPEMTEFSRRWQRLPAHVRSALAGNRFANVYQVVTRAVPVERARRSLKLTDLKVKLPPPQIIAHWTEVMSNVPERADADVTSTFTGKRKNPLRRLVKRLLGGKRPGKRRVRQEES